MPSFNNVFGPESAARQFLIWNVASQIVNAVMAPALTEVTSLINEKFPEVPLSPSQAAQMVVRGFMSASDGQAEAAKSGINADRFRKMVKDVGTGPDLGMLVAALQRGYLDGGPRDAGFPSLEEALKDTTLRPEWHGLVEKLAVQIPTVAEVMNAWLEGQIEEEEAHARYLQAGGDPTWFQTSYNANGAAPTPDMLGTMANRRIIPWEGAGPKKATYEQGFLEGPWRNKWREPMRRLMEYLPPPRTVTAMERDGSLTPAQALDLYEKMGLRPDLAAAYLKSAQHSTSTKDKELARTDILALYHQKLITEAAALKMLEGLHYSPANAKYVLAIGEVHKASSAITSATSRVRNLYVSHKITHTAAQSALHDLGVDPAHSLELLSAWKIEEATNVRVLTEGQIVAAWWYEIITQAEAVKELEAIGYTAYDAWVLLSTKNKAPLEHKPAKGPNPIGVIP